MNPIELRSYRWPVDFAPIGRFLIDTHARFGQRGNWLQPRWEYMHYHPYFDEEIAHRIGVWERAGEIVAVAHFEHQLGEVYIQQHPEEQSLKRALVDYAVEELSRPATADDPDRPLMWMYVHETDESLANAAAGAGLRLHEKATDVQSIYRVDGSVPRPELPHGFRLADLTEERDIRKLNRILSRTIKLNIFSRLKCAGNVV